MPYCLVCLASGTKDPCVRCGHRPSKRVEQLVHLRLKSIYKAFKQSGAAINNNSKGDTHGSGNNTVSISGDSVCTKANRKNSGSDSFGTHPSHKYDTGKKSVGGTSIPVSLPANAEMQDKDMKVCVGNINNNRKGTKQSCSSLKGDVGAVLQVAAVAAASAASSAKSPSCETVSSYGKGWNPSIMHRDVHQGNIPPGKVVPHFNHDGSFSFRPRKEQKKNASDQFASRTEAEADAAAAALLAEIDEEQQQNEANNKAKKSKKKKKKKKKERIRTAAAKEEELAKKYDEETASKLIINKKHSSKDNGNTKMNDSSSDTKDPESLSKMQSKRKKKSKTSQSKLQSGQKEIQTLISINDSFNDESEEDDVNQIAGGRRFDGHNINEWEGDGNDVENRLANSIKMSDVEGIEKVLAELKGVPGRAALRKNAKKAVKRIKGEQAAVEEALKLEKEQKEINTAAYSLGTSRANEPCDAQASTTVDTRSSYKPPEPLLKLVSNTHRVQSTSGGPSRSECVMHMAPSVVGWVIGKGGQRIRDLMEDSGAKVWIDQNSMGPKDMRIVYVSGTKKSIDMAVRTIKDLVAKAPVGGTTQSVSSVPSVPNNFAVNDAGSVASARSSLTSTPVSIVQNFTQQAPSMTPKPQVFESKKDSTVDDVLVSSPRIKKQSVHLSTTAVPLSPTRFVPVPPPGMENILGSSEPNAQAPSVGNRTIEEQQNERTSKAVHELTCEPRFVPLLIGRRGWTVKNIQDTSGARVDIDQNVNPRRIIISGEVDQVHKAVRLVRDVLKYPHAQLNYNTAASGGRGMEVRAMRSGDLSDNFVPGSANTASLGDSNAAFSPISHAEDSFDRLTQPNMPVGLSQASNRISPQAMLRQGSVGYGQLPNGIPLNGRAMNQQTSQPHHRHSSNLDVYGFPSQMHSPQPPFPSDVSATTAASPPDNQLFLSRQASASLPISNGGVQMQQMPLPESFDRNFLRGSIHQEQSVPAAGNYQYDTIPPQHDRKSGIGSSASKQLQYYNVTPFGVNGVASMGVASANLQSSVPFQSQHSQPTTNDQGYVNNLFSARPHLEMNTNHQPGTESLVRDFNTLSFGEGSAHWDWDSLMKDLHEENTPQRRVGLGGVRLDTSLELPNARDNTNQSNWGM